MIKILEKRFNLNIMVEPKIPTIGSEINFDIYETGNSIEIKVDENLLGKRINVYINDQFLFSAIVGKLGKIRVNKKSDIGKTLLRHLVSGDLIKIYSDSY